MSNPIPAEWQLTTIGESAISVSKKHQEVTNENPRYVGLEHIIPETRKVSSWGYADEVTSSKTVFLSGDTLFGKLRPNLKKVSLADFNGICSTEILAIRALKKVHPEYLYRVLSSEYVISAAVESSFGNVMPRTSWSNVLCLQLLRPPLPEQQKIATILSSVDDVIEKTRAQIDKLKDLKTGMMQELLTKGIEHTEFKDSPVGRIPVGWKVLRVSEFLVERKQKGSDNIPIYSVLMNGGMVPRNTVDRRVSSELESSDNRLVLQGDLAYNMMRMWQGASGIAPVDCLVSPAYVVCTPSEQIDSSFLGYLLKNPIAIQKLKRYSQGLTGDRLRLYFESFKQITFAIPPLAEQQKIALALRSVDINISQKMQQLFTRENFKKGLMQDLLTGKVRVKTEKDAL